MLYGFDTIGRNLSWRMATTAKIPIAMHCLMRPNLTFKEKPKKFKRDMKYCKLSSLTFTKYLCHTSALEAALMQKKDPLKFRWLEMKRKNNHGNFYNYYVWIISSHAAYL